MILVQNQKEFGYSVKIEQVSWIFLSKIIDIGPEPKRVGLLCENWVSWIAPSENIKVIWLTSWKICDMNPESRK